ncbi:hypothetical protein EGM70_10770 [Enterobacteriaceae bacterium 89]|nr:hypothetical protein [Enterobacteriaceae bacterium 89]
MSQQTLAEYLGLTDDDLDEMGLDEDLIHEDTGSSGEQVYSYYFNVPEETPAAILIKKSWMVGQRIEIDINFFDDPEEPEMY